MTMSENDIQLENQEQNKEIHNEESFISLRHIDKVYDNNVQAVFDFNLDIKNKEFIVFVGPSGCGKSTTLRMIAGLEEITNGELYIDGKLVNEVHPKDRDIAMVFQSYALYPHMSVYENMAFGLRIRRIPKKDIDARIHEAAEILGLEPYLQRKPKALSGGQRQRVALGRAIVREPKVFLMDEPLSNLDAKLRVQMRSEIIKIHQRVDATTIYVTHDQTEAMTMADRIVIMKDGYIQQIGTPDEVYNHPYNIFVAGFIGSPSMNFFKAEYDNGLVTLREDFSFKVSKEQIKVHDSYYESLLEKKKEAFENRQNEIEEHNQKVLESTNKKLKPIDMDSDEELLKLKESVERIENIIANKKHNLIIGVRPEDIYLQEDPAAENNSNPFELECDMSELLGHERIIYSYLKEDERVTIKVNAKWNIKSGDKNPYILNLGRTCLFDEETSENILFDME